MKVALALLLLLSACGGGESSELLVVGNSITRHGPLESVQWSGDWGMAASARENDFAHLTGKALGLPVSVINAADNERSPDAAIPDFPVKPSTVVVLELGDNGLPAKYREIVAKLSRGSKLACLSTWWLNPQTDAVIKAECERAGGVYVYIGDILPTRKDVPTYQNPFVDAHPHDWGMSQIAERVVKAIQP